MYIAAGRSMSSALSTRSITSFFRSVTTVTNHTNAADDSSLANAKPFEQIPGFRSFPFIGTAWIYFPIIGKYSILKTHHADMDKYKKYGDIVREKVGHLDIVSLYNIEDVETLLKNEGKYPTRMELTSLKAYRELRKEWYKTPGILILQGKDWYTLRSKTQPFVMKPKLIQAFVGPMQDISQDLVKRILHIRNANNEVPDVLPELYKWALESIVFVTLDARLGCLENNLDPNSEAVKTINAVQNIFFYMNQLEAFTGNIQWWKYLPSPTWNKFVKATDHFSQIAVKYINRALEELQKDNNEEKELSILQSMLRAPGLDVSGVMTTTLDLISAGIDTTSHTESFLLYHLAKNPDKQKKLHEEVMRVLPTPTDKLSPADLNELHYLKACVKESMRLNLIFRGVVRRLDHDVVLSGYRVPAGVNIACAQQTINRLEKYHNNADQFIPERWLEKENKLNPYLSVPFGIGMRSCIGRRLAEQEMWCATTEIIRNFRVEYDGEDIDMITRLTAIPDRPLKLKFINHA